MVMSSCISVVFSNNTDTLPNVFHLLSSFSVPLPGPLAIDSGPDIISKLFKLEFGLNHYIYSQHRKNKQIT